jgi:tRNA-Thr(GGU) m(6)t(6)A37 methyltransferase TsaA
MKIEPIAFFQSPFTSKFGVPRQSGLIADLPGRIVLTGSYRDSDALRGLEEYDYLWLIWGFSEHVDAVKHATVRPPILGGNERRGVWATRSPFRPNNLGLSSVRIQRIDASACTIEVLGADLMDGTPIYDIKPYLPYADSHDEARGGITESHSWDELQVDIPVEVEKQLDATDVEVLRRTLALDPRPHYHEDDGREYGMPFRSWDVRFRVIQGKAFVVKLIRKSEF